MTAENDATGRDATDRDGGECGTTGRDGSEREETPSSTDDEETSSSTNGEERLAVPLETLAVLNWLGDSGIGGVEDRLNRVLGDDLTVRTEQVKVGYAERGIVPAQFGSDDRAGARVRLSEPITGNALVLFPMESANKAAALMLQRAIDDLSAVSTEMGRDALTELCNMMVNAFVDEWATLFETTMDTGSPISVQDPERTLVRRILKHYDLGMYIASRLHIPEYDVDGAIYVFPGEEGFLTELSKVGVEVIAESATGEGR